MIKKTGKLAKTIASKQRINIPYTETVLSVEVTRLADGSIAESTEYIQSEKEKKIETLKNKYGDIDEGHITWVMVKKDSTAQHPPAEHERQEDKKQLAS